MHWRIIRALLHKEILRHAANRGGIVLVVLLMLAALLLSLAKENEQQQGTFFEGGVRRCYVDYWREDDLVRHLKDNVPPEIEKQIKFRPEDEAWKKNGKYVYPEATGAIQIRNGGRKTEVHFYAPNGNPASLDRFKKWYRRETHRYVSAKLQSELPKDVHRTLALLEVTEDKELTTESGLDRQSGIATSLVVFGLFFVCVYLMPSFSCEERERGVLLAQALSPAKPREILAAKFLFYPILALALAVTLGATYRLSLLAEPFFWLVLLIAVIGCMGVGLTIASLARTQRAASMGAMCYLCVVTLVLYVCQQINFRTLPYFALEYHCPRMIHAVLQRNVHFYHWISLAITAVLACVWVCIATVLFRRRGWQT